MKTKEIKQVVKNIKALCEKYERHQTAEESYDTYMKLVMEFSNLKGLLAEIEYQTGDELHLY